MKDRILYEWKMAGGGFFLMSAALSALLAAASAASGGLPELAAAGFEVVFPFYTAVAVGEWGKTRADGCFDVIAAQGRSLFRWAAARWASLFGAASAFAVLAMGFLGDGSLFGEMALLYFPTAFFFSSLCALTGFVFRREHAAPLACGLLWLAALLARGLLRVPGVEYVYPFLRFAGGGFPVLLWNKGILTGAGLALWGVLYWRCRAFPSPAK